MGFKGVIFDLDGTLLDTLRDLADAANASLSHYGYPEHPVDAYRYFVGDGLQTLVQRILPDSATEYDIKKLMEKFTELYTTMWNIHTAPYPGVLEMLNSLAGEGCLLSVLSNKPHQFTQLCVKSLFPEVAFAFVYGNREGVAKKPDPVGALEIAEKMNLSVNEILYVGDTATDMQTGNRAGMKTVGVEWGFRTREELEENNAWKIATTPAEVVAHAL